VFSTDVFLEDTLWHCFPGWRQTEHPWDPLNFLAHNTALLAGRSNSPITSLPFTPAGVFIVIPSVLSFLRFSKTGFNNSFMEGFDGPTQSPAKIMLFEFIRTSGGKLSIAKYTGHKLIEADLNKGTDKHKVKKCSAHEKNHHFVQNSVKKTHPIHHSKYDGC